MPDNPDDPNPIYLLALTERDKATLHAAMRLLYNIALHKYNIPQDKWTEIYQPILTKLGAFEAMSAKELGNFLDRIKLLKPV